MVKKIIIIQEIYFTILYNILFLLLCFNSIKNMNSFIISYIIKHGIIQISASSRYEKFKKSKCLKNKILFIV